MNNIFIIEDEVALLESLVSIFEMNGFIVSCASTGTEAIQVLNTQDPLPSIIICDIRLPDITGYEVLKHIRAHQSLYATPFIFLSAYADKNDIRLGMNLGADDYITKPFTIADLLTTVKQRLAINNTRDQKQKEQLRYEWIKLLNTDFRQEFYSPLNVAMNMSKSLMAGEQHSPEEVQTSMQLVYMACARMYRNTKNLILFSAIQMGHIPQNLLEKHSISLAKCLGDAIKYCELPSEIAGITINCKVENQQPITSNGDAALMLFMEIIDNAIRFAPKNSSVTIMLQHRKGANFSVQISNSVSRAISFTIDKIAPFSKFHEDKSHEGLGLGLYNAKELCKILDFTLEMVADEKQISFYIRG